MDCLEAALSIGETNGFIRVSVDEGEQMTTLPPARCPPAVPIANTPQKSLAAMDGSELPPTFAKADMVDALSEREVEVLRLVSAGLPNRDIGQQLFISEKTVKKHLSNILGKLEATNRTQAVDQARRIGLL